MVNFLNVEQPPSWELVSFLNAEQPAEKRYLAELDIKENIPSTSSGR